MKALITGGSRGLGRALAVELDRLGWHVTVTGRDQRDLDEVVSTGSRISAFAGNIRDETHRVALAGVVGESLDLLVNNASYLGPSPLAAIAAFGEDELHAVFDTNVVSPLALVGRLVAPLANAEGVVVNISSDAAVEPYERWGPYGASKAALDHASSILAAEEADLRVYAFDPGDMRTAMHQAAFPGEDITDRPLPESVVPALVRLINSGRPSGRYTLSELEVLPA